MSSYAGTVAVVTGASAGMGRSLAVELARAGAKLAICDVDAAGLADTAKLCTDLGAEVHHQTVNVAERQEVLTFADDVAAHYGVVNYVFNNAGIAFLGTVERSDFKDIERVMDVDFWGVVNGTKAFLPHLIASGDGHVVNTSSIVGFFGVPTLNAYAAAKFAVRGFTESLRQEMLAAGAPVTVTCVHPGFVKTDIAKSSSSVDGSAPDNLVAVFDRIAITSSDRAAKTIVDGARKGRARILVGADAKVIEFVLRLVGSGYQRPLAKLLKTFLPSSTFM